MKGELGVGLGEEGTKSMIMRRGKGELGVGLVDE